MKKLLCFVLTAFVFSLNAQAQDCPRIFTKGDTLYCDPAPQYQWFDNNQPIPGATKQWYLPTKGGNFSVQVSGTTANFAYTPPVIKEKSVTGRIIDERYEPIADATISVGSKNVKSDAEGRFSLEGVSVSGNKAIVTISKDGFWKNTQRVHFFDQDTAALTAMLEPLRITNRFDAQKGATISERGFFLTFEPDAIVTEDGNLYQGKVDLFLKRSFPHEDGFGLRMPGGDFSAIDQNGQEQLLVSYGFMSAEMQGSNGEKLQLAQDVETTLEFYIPWEQNKTAPDSMPLWYFDEKNSIWRPEGIIRKIDDRYVGAVIHFSAWNCDVPTKRATLKGKVVDCRKRPLPYQIVQVGERRVTTNQDGLFECFVPDGLRFPVTAGLDSIWVDALRAGSVQDIGILHSAHAYQAVGLVDSAGRLRVYGAGLVSYSVDSGKTFHPKKDMLTLNKDYPKSGIARDTADCEIRFPIHIATKPSDCRFLTQNLLALEPTFTQLNKAFAHNGTVYKGNFNWIGSAETEIIANYFYCLHVLKLANYSAKLLPESFASLRNLRLLDVSDNQLTNLPTSFGQLRNLQTLNLSQNTLSELPESFGQLRALQTFKASRNQLTQLPASFGQLRSLASLDLESNRLASLPESFGQIGYLNDLNLRSNLLTSLPESFSDLPFLQSLRLGLNKLTDLPARFGNYRFLLTLDLGGNLLTSLPESFGQMIKLDTLSLAGNKLTVLPASFSQLVELDTLGLHANLLTTLPESFGQLNQLKYLTLNKNQLTRLPESFGQLTQLIRLYLDNNELTGLPQSFGQLAQLYSLNLKSNQLTSLPESFGQLNQLVSLYVNSNQLTGLPQSFGQLKALRTLDLSYNKFSSLPESFGLLTNLSDLNLGSNQLRNLPESFGQLKNLYILNLIGNKLTTLPESFGQLESLAQLDLSGNTSMNLPASFSQLKNLWKLTATVMNWYSLPEEICELTRLNTLEIRDNNLSSLPPAIANLKDNLKKLILTRNPISEEEKAKIRSWLPNTEITF